jgi:hypothetical protein
MHYSMFMAKPASSFEPNKAIEPDPDACPDEAKVEAAWERSFEVADCYGG